MRWLIYTTAPYTGDLRDIIAEYANRGHALARLRGLRHRSWLAGSEMQYTLRKG